VRQEAECALRQAGTFGILPTPLAEIMRIARVREVEKDVLNPSFVTKMIGRAEKTGQAIKRALAKVAGLFCAIDGLIFIDRTLMAVRQRFVRLHECAHGFLPWQRPMYALVEDSQQALDPDTADLFDREANSFASEVLFQVDTFRDLAEENSFGILTPVRLANKFNASIYAAIRQYVFKNRRTCVVVVLDMPVLDTGVGFRATLRRIVMSDTFKTMFAGRRWTDVYTPDDDIGRLVPINGHRMSRKRQLGLTDDNGNLHDCVAESFTTGQQVFVLIHAVKALTAKRILLGAAA
jgi:Zn-dependent peptidase ImmA (M78 family)